jgi:phage baseplate assembly protein W
MIAYPLALSPSGGLMESSDPIRDQIRSLLECHYWERVMLTDFGTPIAVFDPVDGLIGTLLAAITVAIQYWVTPDVDVQLGAQSDLENGILVFIITYIPDTEPIIFDASLHLAAMKNA